MCTKRSRRPTPVPVQPSLSSSPPQFELSAGGRGLDCYLDRPESPIRGSHRNRNNQSGDLPDRDSARSVDRTQSRTARIAQRLEPASHLYIRGWLPGRMVQARTDGWPGGGIIDDATMGKGYAEASATLNVFGNNCSDVIAAETMMMVKERFIEAYGKPLFTMGQGGSGGSFRRSRSPTIIRGSSTASCPVRPSPMFWRRFKC